MATKRMWIWMAVALLGGGTAWAAGTAGSLDTTYDGIGIALAAAPTPGAMTADGGFLAIESVTPSGGDYTQWVLYRLEADGSLDTGFGANASGRTAPIFGEVGDDDARDVMEAPDGRLFVVGSRLWASGRKNRIQYNRDLAVACYTATGTLDTNFGDGGVVQIDTSVGDVGLDIDIRGSASSYDIYLCGYAYVTAETSGGGGGKGKKGGGGGSSSTTRALLTVKLDKTGSLDMNFGDGGIVVDNISATLDELPYDFLVDDSDRPVIAVYQSPSPQVVTDAVVMTRYTSSGALDTSFADDGRMMGNATIGRSPDSIALYSDGESILLGLRTDPVIFRFNDGGTLVQTYDLSDLGTDDELKAMTVDAEGNVVTAFWVGPLSDWDITVGRYLPNGDPDTTFGPTGDGIGEWADVDVRDEPKNVFLDSSGRIVVVGRDHAGGQAILARYLD